MEYNKYIKLINAYHAFQTYPYLAQQLQFLQFYEKYIPNKNTYQYIYVKDMLGITELRMALAQALVAKANASEC